MSNTKSKSLISKFDAPAGYIAIRSAQLDENNFGYCDGCAFEPAEISCPSVGCTPDEREDGQAVIFKQVKRFAILATYTDSAGRRFKQMYKPIVAESRRAAIRATINHLTLSRLYADISILGAWELEK